MSFIEAKVLYKNEEFVGACNVYSLINSQLVAGQPRQAWIFPNGYGYQTLTFKDPQKVGALTGVWLTENGVGMLVDGTIDDVATKLSACCGDTPEQVTPVYNGVFPGQDAPVAATYTFTRVDDGDISAMQDFALAYLTWLIPGTLQRTSSTGSPLTSTYTFQSYTDPVPQGNDIKTGETARLFLSNVPAALTGGQTYSLHVSKNGDVVGGAVAAKASLAAVASGATADSVLGAYGTWSVVSGAIQLSTTTVDGIQLTVNVDGA